MNDKECIEYFCKAYLALRGLSDVQHQDVTAMVAIIEDPNADEDEKSMAANTLEEILFPCRDHERVAALIEALPRSHRLNWCSGGACACTGCVNFCGVTKNEWRRWGRSKGYKLSAWGNRLETGESIDDASKTFTVKLTKVPDAARYNVIKTLRAYTGMDLMTARDLVVKGLPRIIMERVEAKKAEEMKVEFERAGGTICLGED